MNCNIRLVHLLKNNICKHFRTVANKTLEAKRISGKSAVQKFLLENNELADLKDHIPPQHIAIRRSLQEHLYLICPKVAKTIAAHVKLSIEKNPKQIVAETNAGLGLITIELLENGVKSIRLYESCSDFLHELQDFGDIYPGRVELFSRDIFHLDRYSFVDKHDQGNRVEQLLKNVQKRNRTDDIVMTIVGSMPSISFLKYFTKCLCLQTDIATYGRMQMFAIMRPRDYGILKATPQDNSFIYQHWTFLYNLFFDHELLEKIPRKVFLPWESLPSELALKRYPTNIEIDKLYLVKLTVKKELPLAVEHLPALFYFANQFFGRGSNRVIPTVEKWVPGCGLNILLPKLDHPDYFEDIDIFTQFKEMVPSQLLAVFKEMVNHPSYSSSPYIAMIENQLVKSETVESDMVKPSSLKPNVDVENDEENVNKVLTLK